MNEWLRLIKAIANNSVRCFNENFYYIERRVFEEDCKLQTVTLNNKKHSIGTEGFYEFDSPQEPPQEPRLNSETTNTNIYL